VAAATGVGHDGIARAEALIDAGVDVLIVTLLMVIVKWF